MDFYRDVYGRTITKKNKNKHLQSIKHKKLEECIQIRFNIETPDFLDIFDLLYEYINIHKKYP